MTTTHHVEPVRDVGQSALLVLALLAFFDALFEYFNPGNGIHGSEGALLVVISTVLMVAAAALILFSVVGGELRTIFEILLVLDMVGTALAAYFLEAWILLALVVLAAVAWLVHVFGRHRRWTEVRP